MPFASTLIRLIFSPLPLPGNNKKVMLMPYAFEKLLDVVVHKRVYLFAAKLSLYNDRCQQRRNEPPDGRI